MRLQRRKQEQASHSPASELSKPGTHVFGSRALSGAGSYGLAARRRAAMDAGVSFEDRMATVEFTIAPDAHIVVDGDSCRGCTTKACISACPAGLFVPTSDGGVLFNYEQCFECGTCYMVCNVAGAITWNYPLGGHGVSFHRS